MKIYLFAILSVFALLALPIVVSNHASAMPGAVFAQVAADTVAIPIADAPQSDITAIVSDVVNSAAQKWPWVTAVLAVMGAFRLLAKPLSGLIRGYIASSPSKKDDAILAYVDSSWWYKLLVNGLNYLFSINLKPPGVK